MDKFHFALSENWPLGAVRAEDDEAIGKKRRRAVIGPALRRH